MIQSKDWKSHSDGSLMLVILHSEDYQWMLVISHSEDHHWMLVILHSAEIILVGKWVLLAGAIQNTYSWIHCHYLVYKRTASISQVYGEHRNMQQPSQSPSPSYFPLLLLCLIYTQGLTMESKVTLNLWSPASAYWGLQVSMQQFSYFMWFSREVLFQRLVLETHVTCNGCAVLAWQKRF